MAFAEDPALREVPVQPDALWQEHAVRTAEEASSALEYHRVEAERHERILRSAKAALEALESRPEKASNSFGPIRSERG